MRSPWPRECQELSTTIILYHYFNNEITFYELFILIENDLVEKICINCYIVMYISCACVELNI